MMQRYETLLLTIPEITGDEVSNLESQLTRVVEKTQGSVVSFERWGKYRLAYPVKKNEYGVYFLFRFETENPGAIAKDIKTFFTIKFNDIVMRDMTTQLDATMTLAYQKPPSLEDMPSRDVGTFLKENKMEGLLPKQKTAPVEETPKVAVETAAEQTADSEVEEVPVVEEQTETTEEVAPTADTDQEEGA